MSVTMIPAASHGEVDIVMASLVMCHLLEYDDNGFSDDVAGLVLLLWIIPSVMAVGSWKQPHQTFCDSTQSVLLFVPQAVSPHTLQC